MMCMSSEVPGWRAALETRIRTDVGEVKAGGGMSSFNANEDEGKPLDLIVQPRIVAGGDKAICDLYF